MDKLHISVDEMSHGLERVSNDLDGAKIDANNKLSSIKITVDGVIQSVKSVHGELQGIKFDVKGRVSKFGTTLFLLF